MRVINRFLLLGFIVLSSCAAALTFEIDFDAGKLSGQNLKEFKIRETPIKKAINKWRNLPGNHTIKIHVVYESSEEIVFEGTATCFDTGDSVKKGYINTKEGCLREGVQYEVTIPVTLGCQLQETELLPEGQEYHARILLSDKFKELWFPGLNGTNSFPSDSGWHDLEAVIMHETAHSLGILSKMNYLGGWQTHGKWALPSVWDLKLGYYLEYELIKSFYDSWPSERTAAAENAGSPTISYARFFGEWLCAYNRHLGTGRPGEQYLYGFDDSLAVYATPKVVYGTTLVHWPTNIPVAQNLMYPEYDSDHRFKPNTPFIREFAALMDIGYKYLAPNGPLVPDGKKISFLEENASHSKAVSLAQEEEVVIFNPTEDDWQVHGYEFYGDSAFYLVSGADSIPEDFPAGSLLTPKIGFSSDEPGLYAGLFRLIYSNLGSTAQHKSIEISLEGFVIGEDTDNDFIPDSFECDPATDSCIDALFILGENDSSGPNLDDAGGILYEADNILDGFNDLDGDGWNNYEELLQGSDASDPESTPVFTVEGLQSEVVTITNNIIWPIEIRKIALTGEDSVYFSLAGNEVDPFSLDPEESREVHVLYLPTTPETPRQATVEIEYAFSSAVHTKYVTVKGGWE